MTIPGTLTLKLVIPAKAGIHRSNSSVSKIAAQDTRADLAEFPRPARPTAPGRVPVTRCRSAMRPWQEYENPPLRLNVGYSRRGHIYGFDYTSKSTQAGTITSSMPTSGGPAVALLREGYGQSEWAAGAGRSGFGYIGNGSMASCVAQGFKGGLAPARRLMPPLVPPLRKEVKE